MPSPFRRSIKNLAFSGIVVLLFFAVVEGSLRLAGLQPKFVYRSFDLPLWMQDVDPVILDDFKKQLSRRGGVSEDLHAYRFDPDLEWILKPEISVSVKNYSSAVFVDKMPKWNIVSNQDGFRVGRKQQFPAGFSHTLNILGDSSSFGWGVEFDETYGAVLKELLNGDRKNQYALANYSIPGFTSFQGRLLIHRLAAIRPGDLVVVSFGGNDASAAGSSDRRRFAERHSLLGKIREAMNRTRTYRFLESLLIPERTKKTGVAKNTRVSLEDYAVNLREIFREVRRKQASPVFVSVCNGAMYAQAAKAVAESLDVPFFDFPERMSPYLEKVAAAQIQPAKYRAYVESYGPLMKKDPWLRVIFPDHCHPNAIGHRLMGEIVYRGIGGSS